MQKILAFLIAILLISPTYAEDDYQLREPSAQEYLTFASEELGTCTYYEGNTSSPWDLCTYILQMIESNYRDELVELPYELLISAYEALQPATEYFGPGDARLWHEVLVLAWLHDNEIDLADVTELDVAPMHITVIPRDFNADGLNEYVLDIEDWNFDTFLVLASLGDNTYQLVKTPLPYHSELGSYWSYNANELREIAFDDFNTDGLPEWFIAFDGASYRGNYDGAMFLLGWRDGELQPITEEDIVHIPFFNTNVDNLSDTSLPMGYMFDNLDDDSPLEIQAIDVDPDNWRCDRIHTITYDWDASTDLYHIISDGFSHDDSARCVMTEAENALFNHEYTTAAYLYEYALTLLPNEDGELIHPELPQFIQLRLIQSYLLSEQYEQANQLLDSVETSTMASQMLYSMRDILLAHRNAAPQETCTALYNFINYIERFTFRYSDFQHEIGTDLIFGVRWEFHGDFIGAGNPVSADYGGCNVSGIIDGYLEDMVTLYNSKTPVDHLRVTSMPIGGYIEADFNGDGEQDWLVWFEARIQAVLFIKQSSIDYTVSRSFMFNLLDSTTIETIELPETTGTAIVTVTETEYLEPFYRDHHCSESVPIFGRIKLWQYRNGYLNDTVTTLWCGDNLTISNLFGEENGTPTFYGHDLDGSLVTYLWDTEKEEFVEPSTDTTYAYQNGKGSRNHQNFDTIPLEELYQDEVYFFNYYFRISNMLEEATTLDEKIAILDTEMNASYQEYPAALQFWKATLLKAEGQDTETLLEYIAIYEQEPDSQWGKLSALYLDIQVN